MIWNKDIAAAPKGEWQERLNAKGHIIRTHVPVRIVALMSNGDWTASYWIESAQRWCMFTKDCPPVAWCVPPDVAGIVGDAP